jgi:HlyD family secretion protein
MMTRTRKRIVVAGAALVTVLAVATMLRPRPLDVEVALAKRAPLETSIRAQGRTRVRDRFVVTAPVSGRLQRLDVRVGDSVRTGAVLAVLAPVPLDAPTEAQAQARLTAAQAIESEASARLAQARITFSHALRIAERYRTLEAAGGLSRQQLDQAELSLRTSEEDARAAASRAAAAAADVRAARASLLGTGTMGRMGALLTIRSPVLGRVLKLPEVSERVIPAGSPILEVGDPRSLEVVADVLSSDAVRLSVGAEAWLEEWGGERTLRACVRSIEPSAATRVSALGVDEQRVDVVLDLLDPAPELGDGYRVDARMLVWQGRDVLVVPSSALFRVGSEWHAFAVIDGRVREHTVSIGHRSDADVEILHGLDEGTPVVLFPSDQVRNGARVRVR